MKYPSRGEFIGLKPRPPISIHYDDIKKESAMTIHHGEVFTCTWQESRHFFAWVLSRLLATWPHEFWNVEKCELQCAPEYFSPSKFSNEFCVMSTHILLQPLEQSPRRLRQAVMHKLARHKTSTKFLLRSIHPSNIFQKICVINFQPEQMSAARNAKLWLSGWNWCSLFASKCSQRDTLRSLIKDVLQQLGRSLDALKIFRRQN